jgi:uncharacterized protein
MDHAEAISLISRHAREIRKQFAVADLRVFGSVARGESRADSDVDVLVTFDGPATFDRFMDLRIYLEELLGGHVDLVTRAAVRPEMRTRIEREAIRVA